jgi:hypothetical protein
MPVHYDIHHRLEPRPNHQKDLMRGFMAEIADPAWFVGRQWQMGEHQGENAASPVLVRATYGRRPLQPTQGRPTLHPGHRVTAEPGNVPAIVPAEAIIEGEANDWWTLGRRIRIGLAVRAALDRDGPTIEELDALLLPSLPEPYTEFSGGYDGRALYKAFLDNSIAGLEASLFEGVPTSQRGNHWLPTELKYGQVKFPCDSGVPTEEPDAPHLTVCDHDGGEIEWWSADAAGDRSTPIPEELLKPQQGIQPVRFSYPGAPHPRWWQIEDAQVDIGGFPPDRSHFASLILLDLVLAHSDDWFTFPLEAQIGDVVTIEQLVVVDIFRDEYSWETYPQLKTPTDWSLFKVHNLDTRSIIVWPTVAVPIVGEALEEVALGVDEDANMLWAVEERAEGLRLASVDKEAPDDPPVNATKTPTYLYRPSTFIPHHWHPYVIQEIEDRRMFVQGRLMDYTSADPGQMGNFAPPPIAQLLQDNPIHRINPAVIPTTGLRLERRYVLARRTDGRPVLWVPRQRLPLLSPPVSGLRFDVMKETGAD